MQRSPPTRTAEWFASAFRRAERKASPYRHWLMNETLPDPVAKGIAALPIAAPVIDDTLGRRDSHNSTRTFFSVENRAAFDVCEEVAAAFQNPTTVSLLEIHDGRQISRTVSCASNIVRIRTVSVLSRTPISARR